MTKGWGAVYSALRPPPTKRKTHMKRSPRFLVVCTAIAYLAILPTAFLRYRLTLDVDVDGVERSGSG